MIVWEMIGRVVGWWFLISESGFCQTSHQAYDIDTQVLSSAPLMLKACRHFIFHNGWVLLVSGGQAAAGKGQEGILTEQFEHILWDTITVQWRNPTAPLEEHNFASYRHTMDLEQILHICTDVILWQRSHPLTLWLFTPPLFTPTSWPPHPSPLPCSVGLEIL